MGEQHTFDLIFIFFFFSSISFVVLRQGLTMQSWDFFEIGSRYIALNGLIHRFPGLGSAEITGMQHHAWPYGSAFTVRTP